MVFGAVAAIASSSASFPLEIVRRRAMMGTLPTKGVLSAPYFCHTCMCQEACALAIPRSRPVQSDAVLPGVVCVIVVWITGRGTRKGFGRCQIRDRALD